MKFFKAPGKCFATIWLHLISFITLSRFHISGDTGLSPMESDEERRERLRNRKKKRHDPARNVPNWVRSGLCAFALIECMRSVMIAINITSLLSEEKVDEVFDNWDNCWRTCLSAFYGLAAISQFYAIIRCDRYSIWFTLGFRWFLCLISFEGNQSISLIWTKTLIEIALF